MKKDRWTCIHTYWKAVRHTDRQTYASSNTYARAKRLNEQHPFNPSHGVHCVQTLNAITYKTSIGAFLLDIDRDFVLHTMGQRCPSACFQAPLLAKHNITKHNLFAHTFAHYLNRSAQNIEIYTCIKHRYTHVYALCSMHPIGLYECSAGIDSITHAESETETRARTLTHTYSCTHSHTHTHTHTHTHIIHTCNIKIKMYYTCM